MILLITRMYMCTWPSYPLTTSTPFFYIIVHVKRTKCWYLLNAKYTNRQTHTNDCVFTCICMHLLETGYKCLSIFNILLTCTCVFYLHFTICLIPINHHCLLSFFTIHSRLCLCRDISEQSISNTSHRGVKQKSNGQC